MLISIFLNGGTDSLNTLVPVDTTLNGGVSEYGKYAGYRPDLHLDPALGQTLPVNGHPELGWNPGAPDIKALHDAGKVTLFPSIGYTHPDQHRTLHLAPLLGGRRDQRQRQPLGWLGRYLDTLGDVNNPIQGLSLDQHLSPSLATASVAVAATATPGSYAFNATNVNDPVRTSIEDGVRRARRARDRRPDPRPGAPGAQERAPRCRRR